ncbi:hypothetical protein [Telluribacter sp. SYSU D00476]|uniref:hypothetical protein n=1 Tax=Telluribacter sp. SYSU D00476 TaxID=2811430 RepID=UPI001FF11807|nr:hypothetical protein [Telluribacter sp. SYSU D00476]
MLDQLFNLIQDQSQDAVVKNPAVPDKYNKDVMQTVASSITGGMQQEVQRGNLDGVMGLLSGRTVQGGSTSMMSNPIVSSIAQIATSNIVQRFGLSPAIANGIVAAVLPQVMSRMINKTSNPNDSSMDFNSVLGGLMGGGSGSVNTSAAPSQGKGVNFNEIGYAMADGKLDMNDLKRVGGSLFGGNSNSSEGNQNSGGLGGLLGGLFGGK